MTAIDDVARLTGEAHGLTVVSTVRPDGTVQSSVVNAGVLDHPLTGAPVLGFVAGGGPPRRGTPPGRAAGGGRRPRRLAGGGGRGRRHRHRARRPRRWDQGRRA